MSSRSNRVYRLPPVSSHDLLQETLWPDEWKILVACILLNRTTRKSVEKILPEFFRHHPDAQRLTSAARGDVTDLITPLGFKNRRTDTLLNMSREFIKNPNLAPDYSGIGEYGRAAWSIFIQQDVPVECPKDHALTLWHKRYTSTRKHT